MRAGTLIVDISANVARLAKDMEQAKGVVQSSMKSIEGSVNIAQRALGALGVGLSAGALGTLVRDTVHLTAKLDDMAEVTGAAVEELSKLQTVARIGGHDMGLVEASLVRLTKGLKGADEETKNARSALEQLGIQAKNSTGALRDPGELMREVANRFAQLEDGADKTAFALDLFGKSGAQLLPFLKDMAAEGNVAARATAKQAEEAERFEKALNRVSLAMEDVRREMVSGYVPAMADWLEATAEGIKIAGSFTEFLRLMVFNLDAMTTEKPVEELERLTAALTKYQAAGALGKFMQSPTGYLFGGREEDLQKQIEMLKFLSRQPLRGLTEDASGNLIAATAMERAKERLKHRPPPDDKKASGRSLADLLNEGAGLSKDFGQDLQTLHAAFESGRLTLEQYQDAVGKLIERQAFAKDLARQHAEEVKRMTEASKAEFEMEQKRGVQMLRFVEVTGQEVSQLEFEVSLIGLSTAEREKAIAARKIENDLKAASKGLSDEEAEALKREAEAAKERLGVLIDTKVAREKAESAAKDAAKAWEDEVRRSSQVIEHSLTDALMRGFEGGKGWAANFKDALVNMFKTLVLRPIIQPVAQSAAGAVLGAFGMSAQAATGGGGAGGLLNLASLGNSVYNFASPGGGIFGGLFGGGVGAFGGVGAEALGFAASADIALGGLGGTLGGEALLAGAGGAGLSAALPVIGGALAVASIAGIGPFKKKKKQPPHAKIALQINEAGRFWADLADVAGINQVVENNATFQALNAALNDPLQYDQDILRSLAGNILQGERGGTGESLLPMFEQYLAPAREAAAASAAMWSAKLAGVSSGALQAGIANYVAGMTVSEYLSPEQRFAGARSLYDEALAKAGTGDAVASQALPGLAQTLLGTGRDVYASGAQFQDLFSRVNSDLARVMQEQGSAQMAVLAEMPVAFRESAAETVAAIKKQTDELVRKLDQLVRGQRQFGVGLAPV